MNDIRIEKFLDWIEAHETISINEIENYINRTFERTGDFMLYISMIDILNKFMQGIEEGVFEPVD